MPLSREMRRLLRRWEMGTGWPKRLEWIEIQGIRGWVGQRFDLPFPIMGIVGENGTGKSTLLQAAASVYASEGPRARFRWASDFFPDTTWDRITRAEIRYSVREGDRQRVMSVRKPSDRWRGNPARPERNVEYIDLSRIQPVPARVGYTKLANPAYREVGATPFELPRLERFSEIMGRTYDLARMAIVDADRRRNVPVLSQQGRVYSGFHQGAGETTVAELLQRDMPRYSLVLIDEVESSLHPRAQRRLIRDLAEHARENELQVVLTTHSPYVLEELPLAARAYILQTSAGRRDIFYGVTPEFAMSKMDDQPHYEVDIYVEDEHAARMVVEVLAAHDPDLALQCQTIPYGAATVGMALGMMVAEDQFPRRTCVFLDGDRGAAPGCLILPGDDAPERVVFEALQLGGWVKLHDRIGRPYPEVADACARAMTAMDHHEWVPDAARRLVVGSDVLWQAMCAEWATRCLSREEARRSITYPIRDALELGERATGRLPGQRPAGDREPSNDRRPDEPEPQLELLLEDVPG